MPIRKSILPTMLLCLAAGTHLGAQSLQTGSLIGSVRDKAGKPVVGAKIRARSGQVERVVVSNVKGEFRLSLLNVGEWKVSVNAEGLQTLSSQVHIGINDTQTANFSLIPLASATVEVVDASGGLDVTQAQVATNLDVEKISKIPTNLTSLYSLDGLMGAIPGVQVAGFGSYNILGATENENLFILDGNVTNQTYSNSTRGSVQPPREFIESVEVVTAGFGAEYGVFGGVVNTLGKSGSNTWSGSAFYATNFPHSQPVGFYNASMVPPQSKPQDPHKFHRYGASIGGPILKDKLFFFIGYQGFKDELPPNPLATGSANWNGLKPDNPKVNGPQQISAKVNWFINNENQIILSANHSTSDSNSGNQYPSYGTYNNGYKSESTSQSVNITWNWIPAPNFFLIASIGRYQSPTRNEPIAGDGRPAYEVADLNYFVAGPGRNATDIPAANKPYLAYMTGNGLRSSYSDNPNAQIKVDLTYLLGDHQIKAGLLRQETSYEANSGSFDLYVITNAILRGTIFGDPGELDRIHSGADYVKYRGVLQSYYLKDVWEVKPGLRLDAGLRYDPIQFKGAFGPYDGQVLTSFENFRRQLQPRIGLTWDIDRDGRKKVFAHFGRSFMQMPLSALGWAKTSASSYDAWVTGAWTYNPNYSGSQPAFTLQTPTPSLTLATSLQGKPNPVATDLRLPRKNAWTLGGDWTLATGWTIGTVWNFWELKDVLEDSYFLAPDGTRAFSNVTSKVIWNPGPGPVTFKDSDGTVRTWNSDFPDPKDRYISLNLHARRNADSYYLSLDYTWVHHYGNYQGEGVNGLNYTYSGGSYGRGSGGMTGDYDYSRAIASGNYEANPVHEFKARGGVRIPVWGQEISVGPSVSWRSGLGQTGLMFVGPIYKQTSSTPFGGNATDQAVVGNQRGNFGTSPSVLLVDLDLSAVIKVRKVSIRPNVSVLNLFNTRPILGYWAYRYTGSTQASLMPDPNYAKAFSGQPGRSVSAGVSISF